MYSLLIYDSVQIKDTQLFNSKPFGKRRISVYLEFNWMIYYLSDFYELFIVTVKTYKDMRACITVLPSKQTAYSLLVCLDA